MVLIVSMIAPIFAVANMSVIQSGTLVAHTATFSPFWTPIAIMPLATRSTSIPHSLQDRRMSLST